MDVVFIGVAAVAVFVAGVVFHKYVVSEAEALKSHITNEVLDLKLELKSFFERATNKL